MIIAIQGVRKSFTTKRQTTLALDTVNLSVAAGEFLCLLGPSGCGKSTLLNLIAGLEAPTEGQVLAGGQIVTGCDPQRVLMFQDPSLFPWFTLEDNIGFGLAAKGLKKTEIRERVEHYLAMVGLTKFRRSFVHEISGGMRQRAALARALSMEPRVLLMDEPFAALDAMTRDTLHVELQTIWAETKCSVVFVTHNVREALILGDRVLLMAPHPGRIEKEYHVDLPRPRHFEDPGIVETARKVLVDLAGFSVTTSNEVPQ